MTATQHHDAFWLVVIDCLTTFHCWTGQRARQSVDEYRKRLQSSLDPTTFDLIYHEEPFAIANELAGRQLDIGPRCANYQSLLKKHQW